MNGVLVIAHGSRAKETEVTNDAILKMVKAKLPGVVIESAFMEFSDQDIDKGLDALVARGVTDVKVVPYFLFAGNHIKRDIPEILAEQSARLPQLKFTMGETLGVDERLADILVERILD